MGNFLESTLIRLIFGTLLLMLILILNIKTALIVFGLILIFLGILFSKNISLHEKYMKLFSRNTYLEYTGMDDTAKKLARRRKVFYYYLASLLFLIYPFFSYSDISNSEIYEIYIMLIIFSALLLNSIIGIWLFRKFKNSKQYTFSCIIFWILVLYYMYRLFL